MDKVTAWLGMFTGLTGSALVASGFYLSGFLAFGASNLFWIVNGMLTKNWPLLIMQAGFTATSILGIVNNV